MDRPRQQKSLFTVDHFTPIRWCVEWFPAEAEVELGAPAVWEPDYRTRDTVRKFVLNTARRKKRAFPLRKYRVRPDLWMNVYGMHYNKLGPCNRWER